MAKRGGDLGRNNLAAGRGTKGSRAERSSLLLLVIHIPIARSSDKREQYAGAVHPRNVQIEHEHSKQDGQHLLDVCYKGPFISFRKTRKAVAVRNVPATVMLKAPAFLFAVKLTMFSPKAIHPFVIRPAALNQVISWALQSRTFPNSPLTHA